MAGDPSGCCQLLGAGMGEHTVPPGPAGTPGIAVLGQQDLTTHRHGHGLVCEAAFGARGCSSAELGRAQQVPSPAFRDVFLKKLKFYCKIKLLFSAGLLFGALSQLRQCPGGTSRSVGTSSPVPGPPCPTALPMGISKAHATAAPPPSP